MTHHFRRAVITDIPWISQTAFEAYGDPGVTLEAQAWIRASFDNPDLPCFIGARSFAFVHVYRAFYEPDPVAWLMFFGARKGYDWEPVALVRHCAAYAKQRGCATLIGGSDTASDVGILLRRVGAKPYVLHKVEL